MNMSPGGSYPNAKFYCSSCHDPHAKYRVLEGGTVATTGAPIGGSGSTGTAPTAEEAVGTYRFLAGKSYKPKSLASGDPAFDAATDPPIAFAPSSYNITSGNALVAYGKGMSEWCKNCHGSIHNDSATGTLTKHPSGNNAKLGADVVLNYNAYVKSGDMTGTGGAAAYNALVPFEHGLDYSSRSTLVNYTATPTEASTDKNVMCLSCHRAHASGFQSMLRWNNTMMVAGGVYASPTGLDNNQTIGAYYDLPATPTFATEQRSLCNKCHAKD
jgi:hypothetical protein